MLYELTDDRYRADLETAADRPELADFETK
jgi:hypothetical protein